MEDIKIDAGFFDDIDPEDTIEFLVDHFKKIALERTYNEESGKRQIKTLNRLCGLICKVKEAQILIKKGIYKQDNN